MEKYVVRLENICKIYGQKKNQVEILKNISLNIPEKKFVMIFGDSGVGKSTLLNIIALNDVPTSGDYFLDDMEVKFGNEKFLSKLRNDKIGVVFQMYYLIPKLSVKQNILSPYLYRSKWKKQDVYSRLNYLINKLGIEKLKGKTVDNLSGGEKQRVAIARALITNPKLLICDEPTGNLDEKNTEIIIDVLREASRSVTVIMVSHDTKLKEKADIVYELTKKGLVLM